MIAAVEGLGIMQTLVKVQVKVFFNTQTMLQPNVATLTFNVATSTTNLTSKTKDYE